MRSHAARVALGVWFAFMVVVGAILLAKHAVALPSPGPEARLGQALGELRGSQHASEWMSVHVLYAECRCSQRIVAHLMETARPERLHEVVLWVGNAAPGAALTERFEVVRVDAEKLSSLGVESAPLLVVLDPENGVRYSGGYTTRKQGPVIDDLRIVAEARKNSLVAALPVFGCAVSERLNRALPSLRAF